MDILARRRAHAQQAFGKLYSELFLSETNLGHCVKRLNSASKTFADSIFGSVPGLKLRKTPYASFGVDLDCATFRQPFNGQWGAGLENPGNVALAISRVSFLICNFSHKRALFFVQGNL